jgi:hypothetical protein
MSDNKTSRGLYCKTVAFQKENIETNQRDTNPPLEKTSNFR